MRKGNKKVSVQIYGKVNRAVDVLGRRWRDRTPMSSTTTMKSTRTGIKGTAKIVGDWTAGYRLEWEYREAAVLAA